MARVPDVSRRAPRRCFGLVVMRGWPASSEPRGEGRVNHKLAHPDSGQDSGELPTFKWAVYRPRRVTSGSMSSRPPLAKLFRLHSMPAFALPAENRTMRVEMGIVAVLLFLDVANDREHAIRH